MKKFLISLLVLGYAVRSFGPDSTGAGSGGDVMERLLTATRQSLVATYQRIRMDGALNSLCRCEEPLSDPHCLALQRLTPDQVALCQAFIRETSWQVLALNRQGNETPFEVVYAPLTVTDPDGATRPVRAKTTLGPRGPIWFHYASTSPLWPAALLGLMAHEFGHKASFAGQYIDDKPAAGAFSFAGGGKALLDAVGSAIVVYAIKHQFVPQFHGIEDQFACTITAKGQPFTVTGRSPRLYRDAALKSYDTGVGNYPRDVSCQLGEASGKSYLTARLWIHDDGDCGPLPSGGTRFTVMELWRVGLAGSGEAPPKPHRLMEAKYRDWSPICTPEAHRLALTYEETGGKYIFELRHLGTAREERR